MEENKISNQQESVDDSANFPSSEQPQLQVEETKREETAPQTDAPNLYFEDEPLIVDETHLNEAQDVPADERAQVQPPENGDVYEELIQEVNAEPNVDEEQARNINNELYQHNLTYIVQNLNNLRDSLQTLMSANGPLAHELGRVNQQNNVPEIQNQPANNEDPIHDRLLNIQRLLGGDVQIQNQNPNPPINNNEEILRQLNFGNNLQQNFNNNNDWQQRMEGFFRQVQTSIPKNLNKIFWILLGFSIFLVISGVSNLPRNVSLKSPDNFLRWMAFHKGSKLFLFGLTILYTCLIYKLVQTIYSVFTAEPGENFNKTMWTSLWKYTPFYDIGLYIFIDTTIVTNKFDLFFITILLIWFVASNKMLHILHNKLNQTAVSVNQDIENNYSKMKKIQLVAAIFLVLNFHVTYGVVWLTWYSSYLIRFVLLLLTLIANLDSLKVFLSSSLLIRNYSLVTNNNTRELSDPKFKVEILIDLIYQFIVLLLIGVLGIASAGYFTGFLAVYWFSLNNSIEKLKNGYKKYLSWFKLQKRLNEVFPVVERSPDEPHELCSICHENLLVARKLQCGHVFHVKCLIYWIENQKTCPNCRAPVNNLNDVMDNNRPTSTFGRAINQITQPFRTLFQRLAV